MMKSPLAGNGRECPLSAATARENLARILNEISPRVTSYCWKLGGDDHDSLSRFMGVDEDDMVKVLRLCEIYGSSDTNVRMGKFEAFAYFLDRACCEWTTYRAAGTRKAIPFIRIGSRERNDEDGDDAITKPKDQYGSDGSLSILPECN
jgi:hypothetical protein